MAVAAVKPCSRSAKTVQNRPPCPEWHTVTAKVDDFCGNEMHAQTSLALVLGSCPPARSELGPPTWPRLSHRTRARCRGPRTGTSRLFSRRRSGTRDLMGSVRLGHSGGQRGRGPEPFRRSFLRRFPLRRPVHQLQCFLKADQARVSRRPGSIVGATGP